MASEGVAFKHQEPREFVISPDWRGSPFCQNGPRFDGIAEFDSRLTKQSDGEEPINLNMEYCAENALGWPQQFGVRLQKVREDQGT
jgi:hypothetical protein